MMAGTIVDLARVSIGMMQLDIILPSQQFGPRRKQAPEQRLMIAVLQDALDCVETYRFANDPHGRRLFDEAKQWLLAAETDWLYSFECICRVLDLDSDAVRQRVRVAPAGGVEKMMKEKAGGKVEEEGSKQMMPKLPR